MELKYQKNLNTLWFNGVKDYDVEEPISLKAREIWHSDNITKEMDVPSEVVRIFANESDRLAVLIPYDSIMYAYGIESVWYSIGNFEYKTVELYHDCLLPGISSFRSFLIEESEDGMWYVKELVVPDFGFHVATTVICTIAKEATKEKVLAASGLNVNAFKKLYPVYNACDKEGSLRCTPGDVSELSESEVFVFGSNLAGQHDGGAALFAKKKFGAIQGQGEGPQGRSYAIPTYGLTIEKIKKYVDRFIDYATEHPDLYFYVTKIGCGVAHHTVSQIAPLFRFAIGHENILLPEDFVEVLKAWG